MDGLIIVWSGLWPAVSNMINFILLHHGLDPNFMLIVVGFMYLTRAWPNSFVVGKKKGKFLLLSLPFSTRFDIFGTTLTSMTLSLGDGSVRNSKTLTKHNLAKLTKHNLDDLSPYQSQHNATRFNTKALQLKLIQ